MNDVDVLSLLAGLGGAAAAIWTAYNANAARKNNVQAGLLTSAIDLVQTLQAEISRLNQENEQQRKELDELRRQTNRNRRDIRDIKQIQGGHP